MKKALILTAAAMAAMLTGCDSSALKPTVTGTANEILVVMDDSVFKAPSGQAVIMALDRDMPCLPQFEPYFNISRVQNSNFTSIVSPARNIIRVNVGDIYSHVKMRTQEDVWAHPQAVMTINGPDHESVAAAVREYEDDIRGYFIKQERERAIAYQRRSPEQDKTDSVKKIFNMNMVIPKGMNRYKRVKNSVWIANSSQRITQNMVIYSVPYADMKQFSLDSILAVRDSVVKELIPGPADGSYMATETKHVQPIFEEGTLENGEYAAIVRGLWRVEGDLMGGPFVSVSTLDRKRNRIVTAECFLYAPNEYKRNALRLLEATLFTMNFDEQNNSKDK